jgi:hypothetical protein
VQFIGKRHLEDTRLGEESMFGDDDDVGLDDEVIVAGNNHNCDTSSSPNTAPSSGYTSLNHQQTSTPAAAAAALTSTPGGPAAVPPLMDDEDREFWNLMKDPTVSELKMNRAIRRMRAQDEVSLSSAGGLSLNGSSSSDLSPRERLRQQQMMQSRKEDVDFTITSLGVFLDLLFEKVELMASNTLTTNLLVTSIISHLCSFPHPLLRSVLLLPDIVFQPSVRGLFTAVASLKQKLDNIMPTLAYSEEAVIRARKYLGERLQEKQKGQPQQHQGRSAIAFKGMRKDSNLSVSSTLSQLGKKTFNIQN